MACFSAASAFSAAALSAAALADRFAPSTFCSLLALARDPPPWLGFRLGLGLGLGLGLVGLGLGNPNPNPAHRIAALGPHLRRRLVGSAAVLQG